MSAETHATHLIGLWRCNDEGLYLASHEACAGLDRNDAAEALRGLFTGLLPELDGFAAGLMASAMAEVDWHDVAADTLAELDEESDQ